jgi:hypothetical protein
LIKIKYCTLHYIYRKSLNLTFMKNILPYFLCLSGFSIFTLVTNAQSPAIITVAGSGISGYSGDGMSATSATMKNNTSVAVDAVGNIFIADYYGNRVRKVSTSGIITTVAGNGMAGYTGDGVAATATELNNPQNIIVDGIGNIFIADYLNNRVRLVDTSGIISTIVGNGTLGYSGDGSAATLAQLNNPVCLALDESGNLFIADEFNNVIRKVSPAIGGTISTVAGNHTGGFSGDGSAATLAKINTPTGITVDGAGNLFITDQYNQRIRKVDVAGNIHTVAGNGIAGYTGDGVAATTTELNNPARVAVDGAGNIYIADQYNNRIRFVDAVSGIMTTVVGTGIGGFTGDMGPATAAEINWPTDIVIDASKSLFISDYNNNRVRKVTSYPIAAFTTPSGVTCQDSCITFVSTWKGSLDSMRWSIPGVTVANPLSDTSKVCFPSPGSYNVSLYVHNINGSDTMTTVVTVNSGPRPILKKKGINRFSIPGAYSGYQWYFNGTLIPGAVSDSIHATGMGAYYVIVDSGGCKGMSDTLYAVESVSSVNAPEIEFWLSQSSSENATLHATRSLDEPLLIVVYDMAGRQLLKETWNAGVSTKQINSLPFSHGLYLVKLSNQTTSGVLKWTR